MQKCSLVRSSFSLRPHTRCRHSSAFPEALLLFLPGICCRFVLTFTGDNKGAPRSALLMLGKLTGCPTPFPGQPPGG